jgi:hypothetical protein
MRFFFCRVYTVFKFVYNTNTFKLILSQNRIGGLMVSVLASSVVDRGFEAPVGSKQRL